MDIFHEENRNRNFLVVIASICFLGLIMVFSSSYIFAKESFGNSAHYFYRQIFFILTGISLGFFIYKSKFEFWYNRIIFFHIIITALLALTFIEGFGLTKNGSSRWVDLGVFAIQPGELLKYSVLIFSVKFFENFNFYTTKKKITSITFLAIPLLLLLFQPDFGTFSICFLIMVFTCYLSSFPRKYFYSMIMAGVVSLIGLIWAAPYRVKRVLVYLDPWEDPKASGFQIIQSFLAFSNGSLFGKGLGNSHEKLFYLPEAHNDFIFSVIGEELGFLGVLITVILFFVFIYMGLKTAIHFKNRVKKMILASIVFTIGIQALLNMGVVLGLLPTKGLNLPFISSGGSSLIANLMALGLFFSISKTKMNEEETKEEEFDGLKNVSFESQPPVMERMSSVKRPSRFPN